MCSSGWKPTIKSFLTNEICREMIDWFWMWVNLEPDLYQTIILSYHTNNYTFLAYKGVVGQINLITTAYLMGYWSLPSYGQHYVPGYVAINTGMSALLSVGSWDAWNERNNNVSVSALIAKFEELQCFRPRINCCSSELIMLACILPSFKKWFYFLFFMWMFTLVSSLVRILINFGFFVYHTSF